MNTNAMRLMHYLAEPITFDPHRTYTQDEERGSFTKPVGFWVSVQGEQDWPAWCRSEEYGLDWLACPHEVRLTDKANIRLITSVDELDEFDDDYATPTGRDIHRHTDRQFWGSDWPSVADRYDGFIIAPYLWERRLGSRCDWYYTWDCASGCIWDLAAIESVTAASEVAA